MGNSGSQWNKWEGPFLFPRRPFASSRSRRSILLPFLLFRSPITQATITKGQQRSQGDWGGELSPLPTFYSPLQVTCQSAPHPPPLQKIRLPCNDYTETTQTSISIRWCLFIKVSHSATLLAYLSSSRLLFFRDGVCFDRIPPALPQWIPFALRDNFRDIKNGDEVVDRLKESPKFHHITVNPKVTTFIILE